MDKREELLKVIESDPALTPLVDEMIYLEEQLDVLRKLPKIKVHPKDASKQKATPAAKMYKEYLQQYTNIVKILVKITGMEEADEESPLRRWVNEHNITGQQPPDWNDKLQFFIK